MPPPPSTSRSSSRTIGVTSLRVSESGFTARSTRCRAFVSAGFFDVLRVTPVAGRLFAAGEDEPGADARLVVLSHDFWTRRFGGESTVVGRELVLDGEPHTVIGVLPRGRPWLDAADVFVPLLREPAADRGSFELDVIGRLAPGVTFEAGLADLEAVA